jgi:hypothetical protein
VWRERVWQGSGHVTFHDAPSTLSGRVRHRKSNALHQLGKKKTCCNFPSFMTWISGESSRGTSCLHLLLANGGSRRIGSSGNLGTSLRTCAVLHPRRQSHALKVKQSHYSPEQAHRVPGDWGYQILRQSAYEGGKVVSLTHRPPLPQALFPVLITVRGWVNPRTIVRPEGLCQRKIPVTTSEIEPATLRLVAQCLNQPRHQQCATLSSTRSWKYYYLYPVTGHVDLDTES